MDNIEFSKKIKKLVSKDELDTAILELSKLASASNHLNEIILHSATLYDIKRKIRSGMVTFEQEQQQKNKIRLAILELAEEIHAARNNELNDEIQIVYNWDELDEMISIVNLIYNAIASILNINQRILSPIFTKKYDQEKLEEEMILLYHSQMNRGDFRRWQQYLYNKLEGKIYSESYDVEEVEELIEILEKIHVALFASGGDSIDYMTISKSIDKAERISMWTKPIAFGVLDLDKNVPIPTVREVIEKYLNHLREMTDRIGIILENLKSKKAENKS